MKKRKRAVAILLFSLMVFIFCLIQTKAQQPQRFILTPNVGLTTPILDNGLGIMGALNLEGRALEYVSGEGQLSFSYNRIQASFLRGEKGHRRGASFLLGPRIYFNSTEWRNRFYVNFLFGGTYRNDQQENKSDFKALVFGHSFGLYWSREKFNLGLSLDSYAIYALRIGWSI